jgi:hypothetical protein
MTHWGVLWRTYLVVHPLLAIWIALVNVPSWPVSEENWRQAALTQQYYLGYFFYASLVPIGLVHLAIHFAYRRRSYHFPQALRVGLLIGSFVPVLELVLMLLSPWVLGETLAASLDSTFYNPKFWLGALFFLVLGQLLALPHWVFFRRRPQQVALRQAHRPTPSLAP